MRAGLLALALLLSAGCVTNGYAKASGYDLRVTSAYPDRIILYLSTDGRTHKGRTVGEVPPHGSRRTFRLSAAVVESGTTHLVACVGRWTPSTRCRDMGVLRGHYPPRMGQRGVVLLDLMGGRGFISGTLNGD